MKILNKVLRCLQQDPATRNSDRLLMLQVWDIEGLGLSDSQKERFMHVSSPESIRRTRQKIQQNGQYTATDTVKRNRKELEHQYKSQVIDDKQAGRAVSWLYDD